jgi:hypothetical protein
MPKVYVSTAEACQQSVFVDCMNKATRGLPEVLVEAPVTAAGALLANKHYPLRATGVAVIALTLPAAPTIGDTIVVDTIQGVTPYTIGGTALSIPAPTGQAFYALKWNGAVWKVTSSRVAFECPGDSV